MGIKLLDKMPEIERQKEYLIKGFEDDLEPSKVVFKKFSHCDKTVINLLKIKANKLINYEKLKEFTKQNPENKTVSVLDFIEEKEQYIKIITDLNEKILSASVVSFDGEIIKDHKSFYNNICDVYAIKKMVEAAEEFNEEAGVAQAAKN